MGLGSRHTGPAQASPGPRGLQAVVVSESTTARLMDDEPLVAEIIPELWILNRYSSHIDVPILARGDEQGTARSQVEHV